MKVVLKLSIGDFRHYLFKKKNWLFYYISSFFCAACQENSRYLRLSQLEHRLSLNFVTPPANTVITHCPVECYLLMQVMLHVSPAWCFNTVYTNASSWTLPINGVFLISYKFCHSTFRVMLLLLL